MDALIVAGLGFALGLRHAADADHVVAVTAIAARYRRVGPAALVGALWGLGHTLTLCVVGGLLIALNLVVPPRVGLALEFTVGIALLVVGVANLAGRGGFLGAGQDEGRLPHGRAFALGIVHGLAGTAAVTLLVLATVRDPWAGLAYLGVFGLGTILGMVLVTLAFTAPAAALSSRFPWSGAGLRRATGLVSIGLGAWVMFEAGVLGGLFSAAPRFIPH
jgi:high-affinity nickel-transport protein